MGMWSQCHTYVYYYSGFRTLAAVIEGVVTRLDEWIHGNAQRAGNIPV